jgi:hypothetical protein
MNSKANHGAIVQEGEKEFPKDAAAGVQLNGQSRRLFSYNYRAARIDIRPGLQADIPLSLDWQRKGILLEGEDSHAEHAWRQTAQDHHSHPGR